MPAAIGETSDVIVVKLELAARFDGTDHLNKCSAVVGDVSGSVCA
jgi:hypothetical protein